MDTLLEKRDFSTAFEKYTDAKSLAKMEDYFVETEDLPMLKKFNKEFKTAIGSLKEAILEEDNKKIVAAYERHQRQIKCIREAETSSKIGVLWLK